MSKLRTIPTAHSVPQSCFLCASQQVRVLSVRFVRHFPRAVCDRPRGVFRVLRNRLRAFSRSIRTSRIRPKGVYRCLLHEFQWRNGKTLESYHLETLTAGEYNTARSTHTLFVSSAAYLYDNVCLADRQCREEGFKNKRITSSGGNRGLSL